LIEEGTLAPVPARWLGRPLAETRWLLEAMRLLADPVAAAATSRGRPPRGAPSSSRTRSRWEPTCRACSASACRRGRRSRSRAAACLTRRSPDPDCFGAEGHCAFVRDYTAPFPVDRVRLTSIYSKGDGVVRWERAVVEEADCVEVVGSHVGLMANRKAYRAIAAALARPELA
jgi:hypothetical protein